MNQGKIPGSHEPGFIDVRGDDAGMSDEKKVCGFCKGKPVGNAATWVDGKPRPPAPCPRCGETNQR